MKPADGSAGCAVDSVRMNDPYAPILTGEKQARSIIGSHGDRTDCGAVWVVITDDPVNSLTLVIKRLSYADTDFQLKYIIDTIIDISAL